MPIECTCETCGQAIYAADFDAEDHAIWVHYAPPDPAHEATPPAAVLEIFNTSH